MKLLAYRDRVIIVGTCGCGKTWNPAGDEHWKPTVEEVRAWLAEREDPMEIPQSEEPEGGPQPG